MIHYVTIYHIGRAYGGNEEGGWWYDYGIPQIDHRNRAFTEQAVARHYAEWLNGQLTGTDSFGRNISSTGHLGDEECAIVDSDKFPAPYPEERPQYS